MLFGRKRMLDLKKQKPKENSRQEQWKRKHYESNKHRAIPTSPPFLSLPPPPPLHLASSSCRLGLTMMEFTKQIIRTTISLCVHVNGHESPNIEQKSSDNVWVAHSRVASLLDDWRMDYGLVVYLTWLYDVVRWCSESILGWMGVCVNGTGKNEDIFNRNNLDLVFVLLRRQIDSQQLW